MNLRERNLNLWLSLDSTQQRGQDWGLPTLFAEEISQIMKHLALGSGKGTCCERIVIGSTSKFVPYT